MLLFSAEKLSFEFFRVYALDFEEEVAYLQAVDQDGNVLSGHDLCVVPAPLLERYAIVDTEWSPTDPGTDQDGETI